MTYLDLVVDFGSIADPRICSHTFIDRTLCSDIDFIFDDDPSGGMEFFEVCRSVFEVKSIRSDDGARMNCDMIADDRVVVDTYLRHDQTIAADGYIFSIDGRGRSLSAFSYFCILDRERVV